jgi:antitoxin (DNA-binding transcriptional repressor) of toxin-antitoxin stability system
MKTATVRDLRNRFPRIAAWIEQGQPVEITRAGKAFADIMTRLDQTFGQTCYDSADVAEGLAASRGDLS